MVVDAYFVLDENNDAPASKRVRVNKMFLQVILTWRKK